VKPIVFESNPSFWFETLRALSHAAYGGADIGEVLSTAQQITPGDYSSWHDGWFGLGQRLHLQSPASATGSTTPSRSRDGRVDSRAVHVGRVVRLPADPESPPAPLDRTVKGRGGGGWGDFDVVISIVIRDPGVNDDRQFYRDAEACACFPTVVVGRWGVCGGVHLRS
jgi:hypothetical protein